MTDGYNQLILENYDLTTELVTVKSENEHLKKDKSNISDMAIKY
jgi:hypothetical protein